MSEISMFENQESSVTQPENPEEIAAVITGLEQYRQRIIDDTMALAKRAKISKAITLANLEKHPELNQIDKMLADLHLQG